MGIGKEMIEVELMQKKQKHSINLLKEISFQQPEKE